MKVPVRREDAAGGTIDAREEGEVSSMFWHGGLAAHVVVVVALRRWRRHEGRRRRKARGPPPGATREGVHGGERADVAHARGALAAGRLRPAERSLRRSPPALAPGTARALRSPPALRVLPFARPRTASLCFEFLIYHHSSSTRGTLNIKKTQHTYLESAMNRKLHIYKCIII